MLNFERFKWGGVRHSDPLYAALDLERFAEIDVVWSNYSCGVSVILQQSAEPLPTAYSVAGPVLAGFLGREQEGVAFPWWFLSP